MYSMEKLQFECEQYKLYSPDSLKYITDNMHEILLSKIEEYKKIFNIADFEQLHINYFDDLEKFRSFVLGLRGENAKIMPYARGTVVRGMINICLDTDTKVGSKKYYKILCAANHELFHILYRKHILLYDSSKRIVWYDEGMAQFMSGENDNQDFLQFYEKVKEDTKRKPNLNEISHGNDFICNDYNGYDLSYLAIRYLSELLSESEFTNLMGNFEQIKHYGETILDDMFEYYDKKFVSKSL